MRLLESAVKEAKRLVHRATEPDVSVLEPTGLSAHARAQIARGEVPRFSMDSALLFPRK